MRILAAPGLCRHAVYRRCTVGEKATDSGRGGGDREGGEQTAGEHGKPEKGFSQVRKAMGARARNERMWRLVGQAG